MKEFGLFDIIGPQMIGPSSSHTAGAARLGGVGYRLAGGAFKKAEVTLYGSFARTGKGHGTDKAIVAGLLGMEPNDERIPEAQRLAGEMGKDISVIFSEETTGHPNTAKILLETTGGRTLEVVGVSVGGGNIEVRRINGMDVSFSCDYPTILIFHNDRPGVISRVTSMLAWQNINIAFMKVFRNSKWEQAVMVIETDEPVAPELLENIKRGIPDITEVCSL